MLPAKKRNRSRDENDLVYTGEIEVVEERQLSDVGDDEVFSPPRYTVAYPGRDDRRHGYDVDSSTRIAVSRPGTQPFVEAPRPARPRDTLLAPLTRHETMFPPPAAPEPPVAEPSVEVAADPPEESDCLDDEMTRLMSYRPRSMFPPSATARASWSVAPAMTVERDARRNAFSRSPYAPPTPMPLPSPPRVPAEAAALVNAPDSLRPMELLSNADASGPAAPVAITMRTRIPTGRPTGTWAAALVTFGVLVGVGAALYARGESGDAVVAQSAQVARSSPAAAAQAAAPIVAAVPAVVTPAATPEPVRPAPAPPSHAEPAESAANEALSALAQPAPRADRGETARASTRPTYVAPSTPSYSPPAHRSRPAPAPAQPPPAPVAPAMTAGADAPSALAATSPAATPAPTSRSASRGRARKGGADADLMAASASDALARAQLEAALR